MFDSCRAPSSYAVRPPDDCEVDTVHVHPATRPSPGDRAALRHARRVDPRKTYCSNTWRTAAACPCPPYRSFGVAHRDRKSTNARVSPVPWGALPLSPRRTFEHCRPQAPPVHRDGVAPPQYLLPHRRRPPLPSADTPHRLAEHLGFMPQWQPQHGALAVVRRETRPGDQADLHPLRLLRQCQGVLAGVDP